MKAVVKYGKGKGLVEIQEVPEPKMKEDEVLIEVKAVSVCGSDLHIYHDAHPYWPPVILGHEFSGVIVDVGKEVRGWKVGDRVVTETRTGSCGVCYTCQSGFPQACEQKRAYGIGINGAYAKYVAGPARLLHRLPDMISFEAGAVIEPIAICVTSILERSQLQAGESVLITGPGPIGLISLAIARAAGARMIGVTGRSSDEGIRFEKARELGADFTINVDQGDPVAKILEMTNDLGVDILIEASGGGKAIYQAFEMVRRLGRICAIGISGKEEVPIPYDRGIFKALRYDFCFSSSWTAWEKAIGLIGKGLLPAEKLITHQLPLEKWEEAFRLLENLQAAKVILIP
ncbi:MAG: zinc-binding dehydrogenase [Thermodesulfobacteriota bacterium]|nr:zinc-binding dehydrogenase [Thermodesulfobacteriota bacterium]